jgi:hypothetical protein
MLKLVIRVRCPNCGFEQNSRSIKRVRCIRCGKSYAVFPKRKHSRVVDIVKGSREMLLMAYIKQVGGKKNV